VIDSNLNTVPPDRVKVIFGDTNVDGIVTGDDYAVIDSNYGHGTANPLAPASLAPLSPSLKPRDLIDEDQTVIQ